MTIGFAMLSTIVLPNYTATAKWLTSEERPYAQRRLIEDTGEADFTSLFSLLEGLKLALRDPRLLYLFTLLQPASLLSQSLQYYFPSIVKTLGCGSIGTPLVTSPVWMGAFSFLS